jgi:type 1 glutamine amidotransferase
MKKLTLIALLGCVAVVLGVVRTVPAAEPAGKTINVVVVTGGHAYNEKNFPDWFSDLPDIKVDYARQKDDSELFEDISDWKYDVIVLYNMGQKISEKRQQNFLKLLDKGVGVVALHHSIAAYQTWPEFARIIGGRHFTAPAEFDGKRWAKSTWKDDQELKIKVDDPNDPITKGIKDFQTRDEVYKGQWHDPSAKVLLSVDHPLCDAQIAWCKTYGHARTVYFQLGHGPVYKNPVYRQFVAQAIHWAAGKK